MTIFAAPIRADVPRPVATLMKKIDAASRSHNLQAIKACYALDGTTPDNIDLELSPWQEYFNQGGDNRHCVFEKIEYQSLPDALKDTKNNPRALELMTKPHPIGESIYAPNLPVMGFITATFRDGSSSIGTVQPVGLTRDGTACLVVLTKGL